AALEERLRALTPAAAPPPVLDEESLSKIVSALEERVGAVAPRPVTEQGAAAPPPFAEETSVGDAVAQIDAMVAVWPHLRAAVRALHDELEETKRSLRDAKEQLSVAHADNDQHQRLLDAQETELAQSRALVTEARLRLKEAAEALFGQAETHADDLVHEISE